MPPLGLFAALGLGVVALLSSRRAAALSWPALPEPGPPEPPAPPSPPEGSRGRPRPLSPAAREARWGPLTWVPAGPQVIQITNDYEGRFIRTRVYPPLGPLRLRDEAHESLGRIWADLAADGALGLVRSTYGGFSPRRVEGSPHLSAHAYGTALDLNPGDNPIHSPGSADQRRLAGYFARHGWAWGGDFSDPDPMHFEFVG